MSLRDRVLGGVLWTSAGSVLKYGSQLAVSIIVARILSPSDYGLIAMVVSVHSILIPVVSLDLGSALIREPELTPNVLGTAFWMSVTLGLGATVLLALLSPLIAAFYGQPELTPLGQVLALAFGLNALGILPQALLRRQLRFAAASQAEIASVVLAGLAAVALAYRGFGVWALASQGLVQTGTLAAFAWAASGFRPPLAFERAIVRRLVRFGAFSSAADFALILAGSGSSLIIARSLGAAELGFYTRALALSQLGVSVVHSVASSVILPALSQVRDEPERFRSVCLRATGLSALLLAPTLAAFIAVPDVVITFLYGVTWVDAAPPLRLLAAPIILFGTLSAFNAIFPAMARTDLALRWQLSWGVVLLAATWFASRFGTTTAFAAAHLVTLLVLLPRIASAGGLVGMTVKDYGRAAGAPLLAGSATAALLVLARIPLDRQPFAVSFPVLLVLGAGGYAALTLGLRIEAVRALRQFIGR